MCAVAASRTSTIGNITSGNGFPCKTDWIALVEELSDELL